MPNLELILQTINATGVVGVLVFFTYAFYKGHIISKSVLDDIIATTVRHVLEELCLGPEGANREPHE